jgi:uncharacterized membrane-anchored protein
MTAEVSILGAAPLSAHPLRAAVLNELHARLFTPLAAPVRVLHFASVTTAESGKRTAPRFRPRYAAASSFETALFASSG